MEIQFFVAIKILIYAMAWSPCNASECSSVFIFKWFNSVSDCQVLKYEPSHLWVTRLNQAVALPSESFLGVNLTVLQTHKNILVKISRVNSSPPLSKPHRPPHPHLPTESYSYNTGLNKKILSAKSGGVKRHDLPFKRLSAFFFLLFLAALPYLRYPKEVEPKWTKESRNHSCSHANRIAPKKTWDRNHSFNWQKFIEHLLCP